jgi:hypothetical protein
VGERRRKTRVKWESVGGKPALSGRASEENPR